MTLTGKGTRGLAARVEGFVNTSLATWGAKDRLRKLVAKDAITTGQLRAWERLRNKVAHGDLFSDDDPDREGMILEVLTLFYRVVLYEIGYDGPATDWASVQS